MITKELKLKFITPCFCSGADQSKAEIRVPSIRGEMRWWHRNLGNSEAETGNLFGSISGDVHKSRIVLRVSEEKVISDTRDLPPMNFGTPLSYILYYANASGKLKGAREKFGPRFKNEGFISPNSSFTLFASYPESVENEAELILDVFSSFGSIGLRTTRGCGAVVNADKILSFNDFKSWAEASVIPQFFGMYLIGEEESKPKFCKNWQEAMYIAESFLRKIRKLYPAGKYGDRLTPLGTSGNRRENIDRQKSALRIRPVLLKEGILNCIIYNEETLHPKSRNKRFEEDFLNATFNHPYDPRNENTGDFYCIDYLLNTNH